ncbi:MAG: Nif3-like dinuclear metal center hexameric protein [Candidatus Aenigmarchaeota archaeon]|nr:Nif3-like dinuclear metal center hexameric protein [Candidatus Aenigmarchaeota archaeon]
MTSLDKIVAFLDNYLDTKNILDKWTVNGLVINNKNEIKIIALAVDPCMEVLEKAKKENCDLLITHHGLFLDNKNLNEVAKKRKDFLEKNSISLFVSHHPLDVHKDIGNSKIMADILDLKNQKPFFKMDEHFYGVAGFLDIDLSRLKIKTTQKIGSILASHEFGSKTVKRIAIVSGSGADAIHQMKNENIDTLITGNPKHNEFYAARELKINVIYAGHYATEVFGIKAIGEKLKNEFNELNTLFIDAPSGL